MHLAHARLHIVRAPRKVRCIDSCNVIDQFTATNFAYTQARSPKTGRRLGISTNLCICQYTSVQVGLTLAIQVSAVGDFQPDVCVAR